MLNLKRVVSGLVLVGASTLASATMVQLIGTNIIVEYDTSTLGLFGAPTLTGDSLSWSPTSFLALVNRTGPGVTVDNKTSTFAFTLTAKPGWMLNTATLVSEAGSFSKTGANSLVSVFGDLKVTPLPGTTVLTSLLGSAAFTPGAVGTWGASAPVISLAPGTTQALVSYRDQLVARVVGTGFASISKTSASIDVAVSPIPEPETYALMLAGIAVVGFISRRRRVRG